MILSWNVSVAIRGMKKKKKKKKKKTSDLIHVYLCCLFPEKERAVSSGTSSIHSNTNRTVNREPLTILSLKHGVRQVTIFRIAGSP